LYLALGFFIFFIFSALDLFITPGMFLYVVNLLNLRNHYPKSKLKLRTHYFSLQKKKVSQLKG
jgi:hypothetical protein